MAHAKTQPVTVSDIAEKMGNYRPEAFMFLRQGLDFTVQRTHGATAKAVRQVLEWLESQGSDLSQLPEFIGTGAVPAKIVKVIDQMGGVEAAANRLNLHVGGEELCWGLRDLALEQWGLLAPVVLRHWGIRSTSDFGRMVFALVDNGLLQKQPEDRVTDFDNVFDFNTSFEKDFKVSLSPPKPLDCEMDE